MATVLNKIILGDGMIVTFIIIFYVLNTTLFQNIVTFQVCKFLIFLICYIFKLIVMCVLQYSSHTSKYQNAYDPIYDFKVS
jgi:hypothetical protein